MSLQCDKCGCWEYSVTYGCPKCKQATMSVKQPLIGPGDDDYGRKPVEKFNPALGSPETSDQMKMVITLRNARAIDNEIDEFQRLRANPMKCPCGFDTIEFAICEVASVHLCPNCRKVHLIGPEDDVMDLVGWQGRTTIALDKILHPERYT